jgi:hypothetical protein
MNLVKQGIRAYADFMTKKDLLRTLRRMRRKAKRKLRRMPKVFARITKRVAKRQAKKAVRRSKKIARFSGRLFRTGPAKLTKRWFRRKKRKLSGRKTVGIIRGGQLTKAGSKAFSTPPVRKGSGGRHDIVPGRSIVEWRTHPELGRGRVLAFLPERCLDVEFEAGGRPLNGVPIEEIRLLA